MAMKKGVKYGILAVSTFIVGLISCFLIKSENIGVVNSLMWSMIPTLIVLICGVFMIENRKHENYTGMEKPDSCNQTINIIQNCKNPSPSPGPSPSPTPPSPTPLPLTKKEVLEWIQSVNSKFTSACSDCIANAVLKNWNVQDLMKVQKSPLKNQENILNMILSTDCTQQCLVVEPLDEKVVALWMESLGSSLTPDCKRCLLVNIMKLWTKDEFAKVQLLNKDTQLKVIQGLLALDCSPCNVEKISEKEVQMWLNSLMDGMNSNCLGCVLNFILKSWDRSQLNKIKGLDRKSQLQVVQSILAMDCASQCSIPSGLTPQMVQAWLNSVLEGESSDCLSCVLQYILKHWTLSTLNNVKSKSKLEQDKIVQGLIALNANCLGVCVKLSKTQLESWLKNLLPKLDLGMDCISCAVDAMYSMWDMKEFSELLSRPIEDQIKIAKMVAEFHCPQSCNIPPVSACL